MREDAVGAAVLALCQRLKLDYHHDPDSRKATTVGGWPDWVIIGRTGILWRECKGEDQWLSSDQRRVGYRLQLLGEDFSVWTPRDVATGRIERELKAIA